MHQDTLCAELERLFELDDLIQLSQDALGLDPEVVGGTSAKATFVKKLVDHCVDHDAVEALCDAVAAIHEYMDPLLVEIRSRGFIQPEVLSPGQTVGHYQVEELLGEGPNGFVYRANAHGRLVRLKLLRAEATVDRRGLQRFLTANRLLRDVYHQGLPLRIDVGEEDGRYAVVHDFVEGQTLAESVADGRAIQFDLAWPLLRPVLEALAALHQRRLAHGALHPGNILVLPDDGGEPSVMLLDPGSAHLRLTSPATGYQPNRLSIPGSFKSVAPEQLRGRTADPRTDVYAFGTILYEVLTGRPPFSARSPIEAIAGHISTPAPSLSSAAPHEWFLGRLDDLVACLLDKQPSRRLPDAAAVLTELDAIARSSFVMGEPITEEEVDQRIHQLLEDPTNDEAASRLESAASRGADPGRIAEAFRLVADQLHYAEDPFQKRAQRRLLANAARLYEGPARQPDVAEKLILHLVELDPTDPAARASLMRIRRLVGKHEEVVEMLLEQSQEAESAAERGRALAEIGSIYFSDLDDPEQALVAYVQAFCEDPTQSSYAAEVERIAGNRYEAWNEVLSSCVETTQSEEILPESKHRLLLQMGRWYFDKVSRPDLALSCYQGVVQDEPGNDAALSGMATIYRRAQQWPELGMVLMTHADAVANPPRARDLRAEAADILYYRLNDTAGAKRVYEQIIGEDPTHAKANETLAKIYESAGDVPGLARALEQQAAGARGEEKRVLLCKVAEVYEDKLDDIPEAIRFYEEVLREDPEDLDALRGLDRCFNRSGQYKRMLANLKRQLELAATGRQKILLLERIAGLYEEEYLDHVKAARACEQILDIEPTHDGALTGLARQYRAMERWADYSVVCERHLDVLDDDDRRIAIALGLGSAFGDKLGLTDRAMDMYELVLAINPDHQGALDALARLRASVGETERALDAIEALAEQATTPEAKAAQYTRAAQMLDERGDVDGAIEQYKRAVDANPADKQLTRTLRDAFKRKGDFGAAVELLEREIDETEGESAKGRLCGEMARLLNEGLRDDLRAEALAKRALQYDPTNLEATTVLGDLAFAQDQLVVASKYYEQVVKHIEALTREEAARVYNAYVGALMGRDENEKALEAAEQLFELTPTDLDVLLLLGGLAFEHGTTDRALQLYRHIEDTYREELTDDQRAVTLYRLGECARRTEDLHTAVDALQEAVELDPSSPLPMRSLAKVHLERENWPAAAAVMSQQLDCVFGDERVDLLVQIGDIAGTKLHDSDYAANSYLGALADRPDDRKVMMKLMQLYSEEQNWEKLVDIILKLAELVDDPKQKAKYLQTAAKVVSRELGETERAADLLQEAVALDGTNDAALNEAMEMRRAAGQWEAVKELLKDRIRGASEAGDQIALLSAMDELSVTYEQQLNRLDQAVAVQEEALKIDSENQARREALATLYTRDVATYFEKAVAVNGEILRREPYRAEAYRSLRTVYTKRKRPDATWCCCQALYVMNKAAPDEAMFYKRMRPDGAAVVQDRISDSDWPELLMHPDNDPLLTRLFALIQPAIAQVRAETLESLGYTESHQILPDRDPYMMAQIVHYVSDALGIDAPPLYQNTNDTGGVSFLHARTPSLVLGQAALAVSAHTQEAAFVAARQVTYFRPGMYVRHLVPTGTGLKAWLFAAIKLITPGFPVAPDLDLAVREAQQGLEENLAGEARAQLGKIVKKLIEGGALDLKKWVISLDLTADRVALLLGHDLQTAVSTIRAFGELEGSMPVNERLSDLFRYSVSESYFRARRRLGITVDA